MAKKSMLTDAKIAGLRAPATGRDEYPDTKINGLRVRVSSTGVKAFTLRTRIGTKTKNVTLGRYPRLTLADARRKAGSMVSDIERGRDPVTPHVKAKKASGNGSVSAMVEQYLGAEVRGKKRSAKDVERVFVRDILPRIGDRLVEAVTLVDVTKMVDDITSAGGRETPRAGRMAHQLLSAFYSWALGRVEGLLFNPCRGAGRPKASRPRERVLSDKELGSLWRAAVEDGYPFGDGLRLLILTAQRRSEVFEAKWSEFDLDGAMWIVPAARAKNDQANRVPLSESTVAVLKGLPRTKDVEWLFPSLRDPKRAFSGFPKAWSRLFTAMTAETGTNERATIHDIRRTVATGLERLGIPLPVSEAVLNHKSGSKSGIAAVYHRHDFAIEKKSALEAWAFEVARIVAAK